MVSRVTRYPSNIIESICEEFKQTQSDYGIYWRSLEWLRKREKAKYQKTNRAGSLFEKTFYVQQNKTTNTKMSCITSSNSIVPVTTSHICAPTYVTWKEKSKVKVTSADLHNSLTATVEDYQNDKLPAVRIRLKQAKARRKRLRQEGRLIAQPESIFFFAWLRLQKYPRSNCHDGIAVCVPEKLQFIQCAASHSGACFS